MAFSKKQKQNPRQRQKQEPQRKKAKGSKPIYTLYFLLVLFLVLYAYTQSVVMGIVTIVIFVVVLFYEAKNSIASEGVKKTAIDIAVALAIVLVLWFLLKAALGTPIPLDAVASCSMLPTLQRGDLVLLHGISNMSQFLGSRHIPVVSMSESEFSSMERDMSGEESIAYYAYNPLNRSQISSIVSDNQVYGIGLYNTKCLYTYAELGQASMYYKCAVSSQTGPIRYGYMIGNASVNGTLYKVIETGGISINNRTIYENYSNPIIIYRTSSADYFSGDIIHRLVAAIDVNNTYYLLTRGDNNPGLDIEFANYPPPQSSILGYEVARVPVLGYLKLLISGQLETPAGCNQEIQR